MHIPTLWLGLGIVLVPTALTMLGLWFVRRRVKWETLAANNDQGGVLFSIVGTIYAIFLAFMVVVAWEQLGDAEQHVTTEGVSLLSLYRDVGVFPAANRQDLRTALREYARAVVDQEWETMARGDESPEASDRFDRIWDRFLAYRPGDAAEQAAYAEGFARLNELGKERKTRILESQASIPDIFWFLLVFGAIATIGFTFLMGMQNLGAQLVMNGVMTAIIMLALFLIVVLDRPFTGDIRAEPVPFQYALHQMERIGP
jgi:amino acid transporter